MCCIIPIGLTESYRFSKINIYFSPSVLNICFSALLLNLYNLCMVCVSALYFIDNK